MLWFIRCLQKKVKNRKDGIAVKKQDKINVKNATFPVEMLKAADDVLLRHVQAKHYPDELNALQGDSKNRNPCVKRTSSMYKLDPFLDDGIIRVGGRLRSSDLPHEAKHQKLIPADSLLAKLILQNIHKTLGHQGKNAMLAELRQNYWIPRAGQLLKQLVSKCVLCRKYRAKCGEQKMSDLPEDRVVPGKPAFSNVGIDYFGPFEVKRGRSMIKRYGVIFTCSTSRAIHLEVAQSLTTDSCINAIRRFIARRGPVECIRSDNGTNLVGAERELRESIDQWNVSKIAKSLQQHNIKWLFNPPAASHFGGFWERLIRSVRKILYGVMKEQPLHLDDEGLNTLMCEVELILNLRPLTPASDDPSDDEVLTPSHILMMKKTTSLPPGMFNPDDSYVKQRWRQIQFLANVFWRRWTREYLPMLKKRQKSETLF